MRVAIVGAGRAGLGLAVALRRRGVTVTGVVARSPGSARRARRVLGRAAVELVPSSTGRGRGPEPSVALGRAHVILLCVPDGAIAAAAAGLHRLARLEGKVVLHTSGAAGPGIPTLEESGAAAGSLHPLTVFPPPSRAPESLDGVLFAIAGEPKARRAAAALARSLGGIPVAVPEGKRGAYHLAASLAANGLVALMDAAMGIAARRGGLRPGVARRGLIALARASLRTLERDPPARSLTGPVARGDAGTVRIHLRELSRLDPGIRDLYRALAMRMIRLARHDARISPAQAATLRRILGPAAPARPRGRTRAPRARRHVR